MGPRRSVGGTMGAARPAAPPECALETPPFAPSARCCVAAGKAVVADVPESPVPAPDPP